jgi:hypothetical protein
MVGRFPPGPEAFGRVVLGPIFSEFALRLHIYLLSLHEPQNTTLLFCARGGMRLRLVYEAFLRAANLQCPVSYSDFMVSRLVAARTALACNAPEAYEELAREFRGDRLNSVVRALADVALPLGEAGEAIFQWEALSDLLTEKSPRGCSFREHLERQNQLFEMHVRSRCGSRDRAVLCDTGLYGSTLRLLQAGCKNYDWSCVLFARSNYKGFSEAHFSATTGLCVEVNGYTPIEPRTSVLRYWHLIESVLEPELPSVVRFLPDGDKIRANLETAGWEERLEPQPGELFSGAMAYIEALPHERAAEQIYDDAPLAWKRLHRAIVWPSPNDHETLLVQERSRDFGRSEAVPVIRQEDGRAGLRHIKSSLWREGAIVERFPVSRWIWLGAVQAAYLYRAALAPAKPHPSTQFTRR